MATDVDTPNPRRRLLVGVGGTVITLLAAVLFWSAISRDEPLPPSLASTPLTSLGPAPVPTPGPALEVTLAPLSSGDVLVTEVVRSDLPQISLQLFAPPPLPDDGPTPRVLDLQVEVGDVQISVPTAATEGAWYIRLPTRSREIALSYRLVAATTQGSRAATRRALVQVRPLAYAAGPDDAQAVIQVHDVVVHNLVCLDLPPAEQLCGRDDFNRWETVEVPADRSTVVAQVDLPRL